MRLRLPYLRRPIVLLCVAALVALAPAPAKANELTVFAAASLQTVLTRLAALWQDDGGGEIRFSFAGSSAIARQVDYGAPADVVVLANAAWMDWLENRDLIDSESRVDVAGNQLVLIAPADDADPVDLTDVAAIRRRIGDGRLAAALVDAVPAGIYAREALASLNAWDDLAPSTAQTDNVRAALALVAAGEVPLGIVYRSDAAADPRVRIVAEFDASLHSPIVYPAAVVVSGDQTSAQRFTEFLQSAAAAEIFREEGFTRLAGR